MTYATFLLVFIVPPIVVLGIMLRRRPAGVSRRRAIVALPLTALVAFVYTTPWDNYLVYRGVWAYGSDRVIGVIGFVPLEEYLFFLLQPVLTGLLLYGRLSRSAPPTLTPWRAHPLWMLFGLFSLVGFGLLASRWERGLYAGLILSWACPILAALWWYGGEHAMRHRRAMLHSISLPTIYLWIADRIAIRLGIWDISDRYSFGLDPFGLPIEEAIFFLVTNVLCVVGVMLFLHGAYIQPPSFIARRLVK